jgi:hypothetical protein
VILAQFMESSVIVPEEVYIYIRATLSSENKTINDLTYDLVKSYIKLASDTKYHKYMYDISRITDHLKGVSLPIMSREIQNNITTKFVEMSKRFDILYPHTSFPPYNSVLHKICELLGYTEFIRYFPLSKSNEKNRYWNEILETIIV